MQVKLIELYDLLKEYNGLIEDGVFVDQNQSITDMIIEVYCDFVNLYSNFCDYLVQHSKNKNLINQSMLFYYMINKEFFKSKGWENDLKNIKHILDQFEPHEDILNYEFKIEDDESEFYCALCEDEGAFPECVLCGKNSEEYNEYYERRKRNLDKFRTFHKYCGKCGRGECEHSLKEKLYGKLYDTCSGINISHKKYCFYCKLYIRDYAFFEHMERWHDFEFSEVGLYCIYCHRNSAQCSCPFRKCEVCGCELARHNYLNTDCDTYWTPTPYCTYCGQNICIHMYRKILHDNSNNYLPDGKFIGLDVFNGYESYSEDDASNNDISMSSDEDSSNNNTDSGDETCVNDSDNECLEIRL